MTMTTIQAWPCSRESGVYPSVAYISVLKAQGRRKQEHLKPFSDLLPDLTVDEIWQQRR